MQNWERLYDYIHEYQDLVYSYYSKHAVAYLTTYWNLNKEATVWDDNQMFGGSYEKLGDLSGIKWDKYLLLPVYFADEISTGFNASDTGLIKEQETSLVIPSSYGITPYAGDLVKFEQEFLQNQTTDNYPIFSVTGVEIHPNTDRRFWKLKLKVEQSRTVDEVEAQTEDNYVFYDYDKKVHTLEDALTLSKMLQRKEKLQDNMADMWNDNSGLYNI